MMQVSDAFYKVNALTQEQRDAAYAAARKRIAGIEPVPGDEPKRSVYNRHSVSRFPAWVMILVTVLCLVMLVVAFLPSAMRLHAVALATNAVVLLHATSVYAAAIATVMMAEIGQVIFSLAAATNDASWQRRTLLGGALVCTLIALSGNAVAMGTHALDNLFAFLETFAPPVLVLITAQILKTQMLHATESKHAADLKYHDDHATWERNHAAAKSEWLTRYTNATSAREWDATLANALRDALRAANRQSKAVLRELTPTDWRALILRERSAEEWWQQAEREAAAEAERIALEEARLREEEATARLRRLEGQRSGTHSTGATGEVASAETLRAGNAFVKVCPQCGERFEGDTLRSATNRLVAHMKRHANERRAATQDVGDSLTHLEVISNVEGQP